MRNSEPSREVVVVGRACRLPGAGSVAELWSNLIAGHCSVSEIPADRWSRAKHGHPRPKEPGKSYVWAAGIIDDVWSFDPTVFGISPREAEQMDPQQRLMLELTWEALEDAGITRSAVAGTKVGVFIGASSTEYQNIRNTDMAGGDAYTATGSALSIIANRVSHAFDFRGPSFTVDTACSSSLVALHESMEALRAGRIDTAVVGGVNLLLGPFGFVVFSQASMLSPSGRCRAFDAAADGYVRAEGGVVLVLKTAARAALDGDRAHCRLVASGVNSDGRTNGIALPSRFSQAQLLHEVYAGAGIAPDAVAFVEAHGTGTRVGDPIEAHTIGEVLGRDRREPLRIGSIKSNIGHLEPASGLAGVLKAMLALEHDLLPPSVNVTEPNPDIPFEDLNLEICLRPTRLARGPGSRYAGVNSFGFGGTNAHVVLADPRPAATRTKRAVGNSDLFAVSAASEAAVRALARRYATQLAAATFEQTREIVAAAAHRRELLGERVVVEWGSPRELMRRLERIADRESDVPGVTWGTVAEADAPVAFVFSGNGSQWPGMGRTAYQGNRRFRETFDEVDALFDTLFGWSITEALFANDLEQRLRFTHIAQPLVFAIQIGVARALAAEGLNPSLTLGHSVGEIAAAAVSGALTLQDAVRVIHARSIRQEAVRDTGRMGVIVASREQVDELCETVGGIEVAAENSPRTFTVAGETGAIARFGALARKSRLVFRQLDLDYPFHCALIDPVREPLLTDLKDLAPAASTVEMISTVTGEPVGAIGLDATYWWRNVREPVRFSRAIERAAKLGARVFVEIGPRNLLLSNISDSLDAAGLPFAAIGVLERDAPGEDRDPIRPAVLKAFTRGAAIDLEKLFGPKPSGPIPLPSYPWQRRDLRSGETPEAVGFTLDTRWHRLAGARHTRDGIEWFNQLDTAVLPDLADHVVGDQALLPGAAFLEVALAVGREWFGSDAVALLDLDISQPLPLEADRAKEIKTRLAPGTNTLQILSRPRLSRGGWQLHATARLTDGGVTLGADRLPPVAGERTDGDEIYRAAESVGLHYGPAFCLLRSVTRTGPKQLVVELAPSTPYPDYGIDPAALDACFHGLFVLFGDLAAERRGTAYIPVRFGRMALARPGAVPTHALIDLQRWNERAILADLTLFSEDGAPIAELHDARFQAARVQRFSRLDEKALTVRTMPADRASVGQGGGLTSAPADLLAAAAAIAPAGAGTAAEEDVLLEGWASAASYGIAASLATARHLSPEDLATEDPTAAAWLSNLLRSLEAASLAEETPDGWVVAAESGLPPADTILRTLAADHPHRSAELMLAASLSDLAAGPLPRPALALPNHATLDGYELGGISVRRAGEVLSAVLKDAGVWTSDGPGLRLLQVGYGPLTHMLAGEAMEGAHRLAVLERDPRRLERAKLALPPALGVTYLASAEELAPGAFDLIVSAGGLHRLSGHGALDALRAALAPAGLFVAVEPAPSLFRDLTLGLTAGWFGSGPGAFPLSPLRAAEEWAHDLQAARFDEIEAAPVGLGCEDAVLVAARAPGARDEATLTRTIVIRTANGTPMEDGPGETVDLAGHLDALLALDGHDVSLVRRDGAALRQDAGPATTLFVAGSQPAADDVERLRDLCLRLAACAAPGRLDAGELWVVAEGCEGLSAAADPVAAGLAAFARTLANEYPALRVRRVLVEAGLPRERAAEAVRLLLSRPQVETDWTIGRDGCEVLRLAPLDRAAGRGTARAPAARLDRGSGGLASLAWHGTDRPAPGPGEIEIALEATGLNFRDVMWAMSLLPEDILEDGFAGPTLGLEGSGTVKRVGRGVRRFRPGDRVLAFAPSAFSTTAIVPQSVAAPIPEGWSAEAAAGVPVAFLTAYYGLVTLGRLKADEWVLIHGAAGGVGLAAIQIAQWRGATVVATAGSPEKRALLRSLGVSHVLNSRSPAFADDLRRLRREGVDVVLNSLSGEAMERGLGTLRPFGRFIELGKRDYVANTQIGLRPFRRNLSYFGVDVDQLLSDRDRASRIFGDIMDLFGSGELKPLPYRVFSAEEALDAFRLMQQSGHVGKLVVRPPDRPVPNGAREPFRFDPDRTHLVTGGFGGFGLEAARWLADRGARHLVLVGRNGAASEQAAAAVAALAARGVDVHAAACDIADEEAVTSLLAEIGRRMPPLAGILHGAMVLDDGLIANLAADQLTRVLRPKVAGAALLDRLTADMALDYFVMFSSITTLIGNPGQGAYVAANGYMEGLARLRRERGQAGLALAWGAIADVGILARHKGLAEALSKRVGVKAMPAREALDLMAQALSEPAGDPRDAVLAIGSLDWAAARRLPALASPTYAALSAEGSVADAAERQSINLRALAATQPEEAVRKQVVDRIVDEIATVLRIPRQDVSPTKRLSEIGLDSLMAIELAAGLQERFELDTQLSGSVGALSTVGLADHLIGLVQAGKPDDEIRVTQTLNERHAGIALDVEALSPVVQAVTVRAREMKGLMH